MKKKFVNFQDIAIAAGFLIVAVFFSTKFRVFFITSGSMGEVAPQGSMAVVLKSTTVQNSDVIAFKNLAGVVIHRAVSIEQLDQNDSAIYATKGDANKQLDKEKVQSTDVVGVVKLVLIPRTPTLGYDMFIFGLLLFSILVLRFLLFYIHGRLI